MTTTLDQGVDELVLVVVDEESTRETLVGVLASAGIRSVAASSAAEALGLLPLQASPVVVVDDGLPDSSGFDLVRIIKERDPEIPVLLLTGVDSVDRAIAAVGQLDAFLIKPVAAQAFLKTIRNALARRGLVVENKSLVERLQRLNAYQALYDPLTGLPNRALLDDRLGQAIASSRRTGSSLAVLFVDLDGFKVVNDLFGHHVGDQLLREMGERLAETRRSSDTVARFGGDEFVVVCPDIRTSASACKIAEQLLAELARPLEVDGVEHRLTASIGIAVTSRGGPGENAETLLRNADTAMYRAKEEGRAGWELFDDA
ncbi:MAG TPA: diguanylate cyclase, partial [Acidimicrobiales bacterium]|nr:diguanylate cyclase [Acidimicrobiales bacterium]